MDTIVSLIMTVLLLAGAGYAVKKLLPVVNKAAIERIDKDLSSTEELARKLTEGGDGFLTVRPMFRNGGCPSRSLICFVTSTTARRVTQYG